jgi:hypothetical protein
VTIIDMLAIQIFPVAHAFMNQSSSLTWQSINVLTAIASIPNA